MFLNIFNTETQVSPNIYCNYQDFSGQIKQPEKKKYNDGTFYLYLPIYNGHHYIYLVFKTNFSLLVENWFGTHSLRNALLRSLKH